MLELQRQGIQQSFFGVFAAVSSLAADCIFDQYTVKWIFFFDFDSGFSEDFDTDLLAMLFLMVPLNARDSLFGEGEGMTSENMLVRCCRLGGDSSLMAQNCDIKLLFLPSRKGTFIFLLQRGILWGDCLLGEVRSLLSRGGGLAITSVRRCRFSLMRLQGVSLPSVFPLPMADRYRQDPFSVFSSLRAVLSANNLFLMSCRSSSTNVWSGALIQIIFFINKFSLAIIPVSWLIKSIPPLKFIQNMHRIEDLSAIAERKSYEESQRTFDQSKPQPHITCPQNNRENYQCPICTRLRAVCPYTKLTHCLHQGRERVYKSDYFMEKRDRMRTFSNFEAAKYEQSRREAIRVNEIRPAMSRTTVMVSPAEEIIYYPVIHNNYVVSPNLQKSRQVGTPIREKRSRRVDYGDDVILTPTQIKEMLYSKE